MTQDPGPQGAYERRVWRLAFLLTGNAHGAALLVDRILRNQPRLGELEPARLDRVVIQHARDVPRLSRAPAPPQLAGAPAEAKKGLRAVLLLPEQPREAWVLSRIDEVDELHMSRAMDCSRTAARNHLAAADQQMGAHFGGGAGGAHAAAAAVRAFADALDPGPILRAHREERRRHLKLRAMYLGGAALVSLLVIALALLQGWFV